MANLRRQVIEPHVNDDNIAPLTEKVEEIRIEEAAVELNIIDLEILAAESIRFKSRATLRLLIVILVQAISKCSILPRSV